MPIHDSYLRLTPLERTLPDDEFAGAQIVPIANEIERKEIDPGDPGAFAMLEATSRAAHDLLQGDDDPEARHQIALLLYHVFHMLNGDRRHTMVSTAAARWAVEAGGEDGPSAGGTPGADSEAGSPHATQITSRYLQLPQHLFWVRDPDAGAPASLDGYFRTRSGDDLIVMGVMGVHAATGAFAVLPLPVLPAADAPIWRTSSSREGSEDFHSEMPGADLEGLYELQTAGELLKLVARLDRLEHNGPGVIRPVEPPADGPDGPEPSRLRYDRLDLA